MKISFQKFEGAGNDFVIIDNRKGLISRPGHMARKLCHRHRSVGGDGLLLVEKSKKASYRMMYYNADGSYGGMCGNGGRCIALFAFMNGLAPRKHTFEALDHLYEAQIIAQDKVRLRMKDPKDRRAGINIRAKHRSFKADYVDTGSPHAVIEVKTGTLANLDVVGIGRSIRHHQAFGSKGTNANFIEVIGPKSIRMRTYERGVEAETLACGTGSVACSIVAAVRYSMRSPITVIAASGDRLKVSFKQDRDDFREVILEGPARRSFQGNLDV